VESAGAVISDVYQWASAYGGDEELKKKIKAPNFYQSHPAQEIRYLFYEYEIDCCHGQEPALDWTTFANSKKSQVEHIWPRGLEWLGDTKETHDANVNRLGNLTVTHFNQTLSAKAFREKRKIYAKSSILVENQLQQYRKWGVNHIDRRERELVDFVMRRWALPVVSES